MNVSLSEHGCSTRLWGNWFWNTYLSLASQIIDIHPHWISFLFRRSFGSLGPCQHCCESHRKYAYRPENNLEKWVFSAPSTLPIEKRMVRWVCVLKNNVNTKLNKPLPPLDLIEFGLWRDPDFPNRWTECFFNWLYCQAIMFPIDVSLNARRRNPKLAKQYQDFVHFFTQLRHMLP